MGVGSYDPLSQAEKTPITEVLDGENAAVDSRLVPSPRARRLLQRCETFARAGLALFGIDRAVGYVLVGRLMSVFTTPLTLYFIVRKLSAAQQGYYYTFGNLLALTVFFELGLNYVIMQFASHEMASLEWTDQGTLRGDPTAKARLSDLFRKAIVWYSVAATLIVVTILPAGLHFFSIDRNLHPEIVWRGPWVWMVIASAAWCLVSPAFAILTGCGLVQQMQRNGVFQQAGAVLCLWIALALGLGLYAGPISASFASLYVIAWYWVHKRAFATDLFRGQNDAARISWRSEVWPMQWRIAVSWASSYLVSQLFSPILFRYAGAEAAGRMGMTLSLAAALSTTSSGWISTKAPLMGKLVAQQNFVELDRVFFRALRQSTVVIVLTATALFSVLWSLQLLHHPYGTRILPAPLVAALLINAVLVHIANAGAVYLRSHRREPLAAISLGYGSVVALSGYVLGRFVGVEGMVAGYFGATLLINLGGTMFIFVRSRREWHAPRSHVIS